ncbi:MAG: MATE family efflux transporter [Lachnospiraceae bacterium]|nr:MATE family efflux transporter [Lachnospiraceae bacterium]
MHSHGTKKYEIDMTHGPLTGKILLFSVPLMLSGILQLLFNAADIIVVGQFASSYSVAAVGSTVSLINLLVSVFMGLSVGVNVLVAHYYAVKNAKDVSDTVHTSVAISLLFGIVLGVFGFFIARPLLIWMGSPDEVIGLSTLYMRVYFVGMPVNLLYNMAGAVLRAVGDTRRPLYYLTVAGIVNVIMNLVFVIVFRMDVAGVALATILSQALSAFLVMRALMRTEELYRFEWKKLSVSKQKLRRILHIGLPAGLQGTVFSVSNVLIQTQVNSFGALAMAGNAAAQNLEGFVYIAMNALYQACVTFTSQNYSVLDFRRVRAVLLNCLAIVTAVGVVTGNLVSFFGPQLVRIYTAEPDAVAVGVTRLSVICALYFICGIMDTICGSIRGLGSAVLPMIVSILGACGLRILLIWTVFRIPAYHSLGTLYALYPVTWTVTAIVHLICFLVLYQKAVRHTDRLRARQNEQW